MPDEPYAYAERRRCRAGLDYHGEVCGHFYSVPHRLMREVIETRITDQAIELYRQKNRFACHVRHSRQHRHTTIAEHMPSAHLRHAEWTPTRLLREGEAVGPSTIALVGAPVVGSVKLSWALGFGWPGGCAHGMPGRGRGVPSGTRGGGGPAASPSRVLPSTSGHAT